MSDEEIKDFLRLSPIYDRLSDDDKEALLEDMKLRYFRLYEPEPPSFKSKPTNS